MAQVPPFNQPMKQCPNCRTMAALDANWCVQCGHVYSTRFNNQTQAMQPAPMQQYPGAQYPGGQFVQVVNAYPIQPRSTGLAITAMVLGIVSLFVWCLPLLAILLGVLAIIFGAVGYKQHKGMAITGLICGSVHFVFWVGLFLVVALGAGAVAGAAH